MEGKRFIPYALMTLLSSSPTHEQMEDPLLPSVAPETQGVEAPPLISPVQTIASKSFSKATLLLDLTIYPLEVQLIFSLRNADGSLLFCSPEEVHQFQMYGGSLQEAEAYSEITTPFKIPIYRACDKPGPSLYKEKGGTLDDLVLLLDITQDGTDQTDSLFKTWEELVLYNVSLGDPLFARELAAITNTDGTLLFKTPQDYASAALMRRDKKITAETIKKFHSIKGEAGIELFPNAYDLLPVLAVARERKMTLDDFVALGDIKMANGTPLFKTADDYSRAANNEVTRGQLVALVKLKNRKGEPLFTRGADAVLYVRLGKTKDYLKKLLAIQNKEGEQIFSSGMLITPFTFMEGNISDAQSLATLVDESNKPLLKPYQVARYAALGYNADSLFHEPTTEKPNMLLLFSQSDWNGAFQNMDVKKKLYDLKLTYDVSVGFLEDDMLFERVPNALENTQLVTIAGHGNSSAITLGDGPEEQYLLDKSDASFCQALTYLPSDAVVFLFSCSTAAGGPGANTFAEFVADCAPGRKLLASTEPFASSEFTVTSAYPFSVTITVQDNYPYNKDPMTNTDVNINATYERVAQQPQKLVITKIEQ